MTDLVQKVLIVDDSKTNLALLQHMLEEIDCEVVRAENGLEAVEQVKAHDLALILLDIQMPGINGYETAFRIKEVERGKHVPIIFITAIFQDDDNVREGYETGAVDYLFRPVDVQILTSKVKAFLQMNEQKVLLEQEIARHKKTEIALRRAEEKYRSIFERAVEGMFQCTLDGTFLEVNPAMLRILGYDSVQDVLSVEGLRLSIMKDDEERKKYKKLLDSEDAVTDFECHLTKKDGSIIWCSESSRLVSPPDGAPFIEGVMEDISVRKCTELELQRLATVDSLTGVYNRHSFFDRLEHALAIAKRRKSRVALLFIDLNDFKMVNDTYGHPIGDELLSSVAKRLQQRTRESDTLARIGGDEFGVLLSDVTNEAGVASVASGLLDVLSEPFTIDGQQVSIGATIGISFYPEDGKDCVTLISRADAAMYGVKKRVKENSVPMQIVEFRSRNYF